MNLGRIGTIAGLELTQRVRSIAWYVLLGVFAVVLLLVTVLAFGAFSGQPSSGPGVYSTVVYIVLLLAVLVSPTLSGNAVNGDRDAATLAPVQVTLATTGEILTGKVLAAWATGLAFVVVAVPFLLAATATGGASPVAVAVSLAVLVVEIGVIAAVGVALSGILARPLFSVATTYLVVAALTIGTLIAFGLAGTAYRSDAVNHYRPGIEYDQNGAATECGEWESNTYQTPRFDRVWWMLAPNPFVILADATPITLDEYGNAVDLFGQLALSVRGAQIPPTLEHRWDDCNPAAETPTLTPAQILERTTPSWFVGLLIQLVLAAALLWWAWARTRTPARRLPPGTRIA